MSHLLKFYFDNRNRELLHESDAKHLTFTSIDKKLPAELKEYISQFLTLEEELNFNYYNNEVFPEEKESYFKSLDNDFVIDKISYDSDFDSDDYEEEHRLEYQLYCEEAIYEIRHEFDDHLGGWSRY